jgi:pyrroline-5-carboxylate reductase
MHALLNSMAMLFVGCGNMGLAMLSCWCETGAVDVPITVLKPTPLAYTYPLVSWVSQLEDIIIKPSVIVLAVKPQQMHSIVPDIAARFGTIPLYITIAAGLTLASYQTILGDGARVIRAMPNTPVAIGQGVTTLVSATTVSDAEREYTQGLFDALGHAYWLENEAQMNVATALAGSSPAYQYLFMEALAKAGAAHGLSETMARELAMRSLCGAAMLAAQSQESLTALRQNVASKGGTTEAALQQFMADDGLFALVQRAVDAAITRADMLNAASSLGYKA